MPREPIVNPLLRVCFIIFVLAIIVLEFPGARDYVNSPYSGLGIRNLIVQNVEPDGPNAGRDLQYGDEVVAVDGTRVRNYNHFRFLINNNQSGEPQTLTLLRDGKQVHVEIEYASLPARLVTRKFIKVFVAFTFLLVGIFVYIRRSDLLGVLFALNCTFITFFLTDRPAVSSMALQLFGELCYDLITVLFPVIFVSFFLIFPGRSSRETTRRPKLRMLFLLFIPVIIYLITTYLVQRRFFLDPADVIVESVILGVTTLYSASYIVASLVFFIRNYIASPSAQKRRLRIAIAGTIAGILPFFAVIIWRQISPGAATVLENISVLCLSFVSISFGYAILKHGAIELNVVMRKSLVYAFLTGLIVAVYYMLVHFIGDFFAHEFNMSRTLFTVLAILFLAVIFAPARNRVQQVVDRLFYRGDYTYKDEVVEFNRMLSKKLARDEIQDCFLDKVDNLLGSTYVAMYSAAKNHTFQLEKSTGATPSLPTGFPAESMLARYLSRYRKALMVEYIDYSWQEKHFDPDSRTFIQATRAAVVLPVVSYESINGLAVLGEKRSGLPYSRADAELLQTFAELLGVVLENASLQEATLEQERLKKDVMLARDIQLSLLPKEAPQHPAVDMVGKMLSSREIGGDYFDYFALDDNHIAVAIGDVGGKSVPAAMLMFSLQAVFKGMALKDRLPPSEVISEMNRHLCGSAENGQFATFFYGVIDVNESSFQYSNAGHCPALLFKENYTDRLSEGGMMLGVDNDWVYREGSVHIDKGDIICLYTDGVSEQKKPGSDDEFGEDGLIEFVKANRFMPIGELQEALFNQLMAFGQGQQADDITTVIAHYKGV